MVQAADKAPRMEVVDGGKAQQVTLEDAVKSVSVLGNEMIKLFPERREMIRGLVTAFIAKQHMVVLGPPGTGKTLLSRTLSEAFGMSFYSRLITGQTTEDEIFGAPDILKYQSTGEYIRNTKGRAPEAQVVLYDECFKGNSKLLNANLAFMEERHIENPDVQECPLVTMIGLSNEPPEDETLEAFWSRFSLRMWVGYVKTRASQKKLLKGALGGGFKPKNKVSAAEVAVLQDAVEAVAVPGEMVDLLLDLLEACRNEGLVITDRSIIQAATILQATAVLHGSTVVTEDHFEMLPFCWASDADEVSVIKRHVKRLVEAAGAALKELKAKVEEYRTKVGSINNDNCRTLNTEGEALKQEIKVMLDSGVSKVGQLKTIQQEVFTLHQQAWEFFSMSLM